MEQEGCRLKKNNNNGFTLLEIMVAVAILAIAFLAVLRTTQSNIQSTLHVKNALISNWVALNIYSELQLGILPLSATTPLQGTTNMLQSDWNWQVSVTQNAADNSFKRVEIDVSQQGKTYQHLIGFLQ